MKEKDIAEKVLDFACKSKLEDCRYLNVKWLARNYGVIVPHLSAHFKKKYDMQLKDILINTKAMHGIRLLVKKKNLKVKEIARMLDFSSVHGFDKMIKRLYGVTPYEYRVRPPLSTKISAHAGSRKEKTEKYPVVGN